MFHELPPKVRRIVLRELARVLKSVGRLILVNSLSTAMSRTMTACSNSSRRVFTSPII